MIKTVGLLSRKPGWTHEQFVEHWVEIHAPLAHAVPGQALHADGATFIGRIKSYVVEEKTIVE